MQDAIISIHTLAERYLSTRPTSISVTFTGDTVISQLDIYDTNDVLISVLTGIESGKVYSIMTGIESAEGVPEWLVPVPIHRLDFHTDLDDPPTLKVTGIAFGLRVMNGAGELTLMEVTDYRLTGNPSDGYVTGGTGAVVTGTITNLEAVENTGEYYHAFGRDEKAQRLTFGSVRTNPAKRLRGEI